jgi:hypothetical protein
VPVGDFFGYSFGRPAAHSLLFGTEKGWNYARFPMPFAHATRIELVSDRSSGAPVKLQSEIVFSDIGKATDEGTFHAEWRRENPTTAGRPFTYVDVTGRGQLVGVILQAQGLDPSPEPGHTPFFEGDDEATIDGEMRLHGGGSEESLGGGWYEIPGRWDRRGSRDFYGCLDYYNYLERTGGYRLFIGDAYSFHTSLRYTIEHAPEKNDIPADYTSTTFYYLDNPEGTTRTLPTVTTRKVHNPDHFVLSFAPSPPPIDSLTMASLQLSGRIGGKIWVNFVRFSRDLTGDPSPEEVRQLDPNADLPDGISPVTDSSNFDAMSGPPQMVLNIQVPRAGEYAISVDGFSGPDQAMLQMRVDDDPVGTAVDFYAPESGRTGPRALAAVHLNMGQNLLYFSLPGKNPRSRGESVSLISIRGAIVE